MNKSWFIILLILFGFLYIVKYKKVTLFKNHFLFITILLINLLITKIFISFNMQINYEKNIYSDRIIFMLIIILLPILLSTFYFWFNKIIKKKKNYKEKIFFTILTTIIITTSIYFSYPVYNKYKNSKSFNVTTTDIKTVQLIEKDSNQEPYIVLSNQMIGAAAIKEYGFSHYYNDNFYYSMPLGTDNIYQNYLNMIEINATKEEAVKAMNNAEVDKLYFVVNNYWHSAKTALKQAYKTSDGNIIVDNGVNTIFIYNR